MAIEDKNLEEPSYMQRHKLFGLGKYQTQKGALTKAAIGAFAGAFTFKSMPPETRSDVAFLAAGAVSVINIFSTLIAHEVVRRVRDKYSKDVNEFKVEVSKPGVELTYKRPMKELQATPSEKQQDITLALSILLAIAPTLVAQHLFKDLKPENPVIKSKEGNVSLNNSVQINPQTGNFVLEID